jgi:hypothetical protein
MVKYEQLKEYMMDKTKVILKDEVNEKLKNAKMAHGFESDSDTVDYLVDIENLLRSKQMLKKSATCESCDKRLELKDLKTPRKYTHWHVDRGNCHGKLSRMTYDIKEPVEMLLGTNEAVDQKVDTNEQPDQDIGEDDTIETVKLPIEVSTGDLALDRLIKETREEVRLSKQIHEAKEKAKKSE